MSEWTLGRNAISDRDSEIHIYVLSTGKYLLQMVVEGSLDPLVSPTVQPPVHRLPVLWEGHDNDDPGKVWEHRCRVYTDQVNIPSLTGKIHLYTSKSVTTLDPQSRMTTRGGYLYWYVRLDLPS